MQINTEKLLKNLQEQVLKQQSKAIAEDNGFAKLVEAAVLSSLNEVYEAVKESVEDG